MQLFEVYLDVLGFHGDDFMMTENRDAQKINCILAVVVITGIFVSI